MIGRICYLFIIYLKLSLQLKCKCHKGVFVLFMAEHLEEHRMHQEGRGGGGEELPPGGGGRAAGSVGALVPSLGSGPRPAASHSEEQVRFRGMFRNYLCFSGLLAPPGLLEPAHHRVGALLTARGGVSLSAGSVFLCPSFLGPPSPPPLPHATGAAQGLSLRKSASRLLASRRSPSVTRQRVSVHLSDPILETHCELWLQKIDLL